MEFLKTKRFQNSLIVATNLGFDYFGLFGKNTKESMQFNTLFQGSNLLYSKSYIVGQKFQKKSPKNGSRRIMFIDTWNYYKGSVEDMGDILKMPKYEKPSCFTKKPKNEKEFRELLDYNMQDSKISKLFFEFIMEEFYKLGASFKPTIASISMSVYQNNFLDDVYFQPEEKILLKDFECYYGGRTEAFARGKIKDYFYYDVNSLYPHIMKDIIFPDPNSRRETHANKMDKILQYEGHSKVTVKCPDMKYPILPYRYNDKLTFPVGTFTGDWTHNELRHALDNGYQILHVYRSVYYKKTCRPFIKYVDFLYPLKQEYTDTKDKRKIVVKLLLNSLYGKFGQKFLDKDNWIPFTHTKEELLKLKTFEVVEDYLCIKQDCIPACFCIPIWASYVTAGSRVLMHKAFKQCEPVYCDTDSLITKNMLPTSSELGKLKLEMKVDFGFIVKPKMYALVDNENNEYVKIKGVGRKVGFFDFQQILKNPKVIYQKFIKFKEAVRRHMTPNEIVEIEKVLNLDDNKRSWLNSFSSNGSCWSSPIVLDNGEEVIFNNETYIYEIENI